MGSDSQNSHGPSSDVTFGYPDSAAVRDPTTGETIGSVPVRTVIEGQDVTDRAQDDPRSRIARPSPAHLRLLERLSSGRYCGNCRSFNRERGRELCHQEKFWPRIKHEHGWSGGAKWTGPTNEYGFCEELGDAMVHQLAPADAIPELKEEGCDLWKVAVGRLFFGRSR